MTDRYYDRQFAIFSKVDRTDRIIPSFQNRLIVEVTCTDFGAYSFRQTNKLRHICATVLSSDTFRSSCLTWHSCLKSGHCQILYQAREGCVCACVRAFVLNNIKHITYKKRKIPVPAAKHIPRLNPAWCLHCLPNVSWAGCQLRCHQPTADAHQDQRPFGQQTAKIRHSISGVSPQKSTFPCRAPTKSSVSPTSAFMPRHRI